MCLHGENMWQQNEHRVKQCTQDIVWGSRGYRRQLSWKSSVCREEFVSHRLCAHSCRGVEAWESQAWLLSLGSWAAVKVLKEENGWGDGTMQTHPHRSLRTLQLVWSEKTVYAGSNSHLVSFWFLPRTLRYLLGHGAGHGHAPLPHPQPASDATGHTHWCERRRAACKKNGPKTPRNHIVIYSYIYIYIYYDTNIIVVLVVMICHIVST